MGTQTIKGYGTISYVDDIYNMLTTLRVSDLITSINHWHNAQNRPPSPVGLSKFRKAELAAILAHLRSLDRFAELERSQQKSGPVIGSPEHTKAVKDSAAGQAACRCGVWVDVLENGTFKRHTRHNIMARPQEINAGIAPRRVRCQGSGQFPTPVVHMREDTNQRDSENHRPLTYKSTQITTARQSNLWRAMHNLQSRRARKVGTKNKHRANYGKRFQVSA